MVAWIAAVLLGAVVLGFGLYELYWKRARLVRDLALLQADLDQPSQLGAARAKPGS